MNKINTSLYLPADFHEKVKKEAKRRKYKVNQWITLLLARELGEEGKQETIERDWRVEQREHRSHLQVLRNYHIEEWESKEKFIEDMGNCPSTEYYLVVLDDRKPYSPENCLWATSLERQYIKRNIRTVVDGIFCDEKMMKKLILERRHYKSLDNNPDKGE